MQNRTLNQSIYSGEFNYPFGMVMPDRSGAYSGTYRYGFQGQERDDEIKGNGNHINFKYRMHDPRLGRFLSRDPLAYTYAYNSPYAFQENKLGLGTELEGLELNPWGEISTADYLNESIVGIGFGLGEGVYAGGESLVGGIYTLVTDFPSVYNGIKYAVSNPTETYEAVKTSLLETAAKLATGTNREKAQVVGEGIFIAAETVFGTKGATKLLKTTKLRVPKAIVGFTKTLDYKKTFFTAFPKLKGKVVVHHAIERQILKRYPGLFKEGEIHSLENLRGIPREVNVEVHLSKIRKEWNKFYRTNSDPSRQQVLDKATEIDNIYGSQFDPALN